MSVTRRSLSILITSLIAMLLLCSCLTQSQELVLTELNADRRNHELPALNPQPDAQRKAQAWAEKLARENKLYHSTLSDGIKVKWCSLGENIGYGPNVATIEGAYIASPEHRVNVLNTKWNGVGVGYAVNGKRVFTVQVFIKTC